MSTNILGIPSTDKYSGSDLGSLRRQVFTKYPNRGMSLTGILSLVDTEKVNHVKISWFEDYFRYWGSTTRGTNPLTKTAPSTGDADDGTVATTTEVSDITASVYMKVASTVDYRLGQIVSIDPSGINLQFRVLAVTRGAASDVLKGYLTLQPVRAIASYVGTNYTAGTQLPVVASAFGQGSTVTKGLGATIPEEISNYVQLFRTPMQFTIEALKTPMRFDKSGIYAREARKKVQEHMCALEAAILFGKRSASRRTVLNSLDSSNDSDGKEILYTMSGLVELIQAYDAGSTGITVDGATYAPFAHKSAALTDDDEEKRLITNSDGLMTYDRLAEWMRRANSSSAQVTTDRLGICGQKVVMALNKMARNETSQILATKDKVFGLDMTSVLLPTGTLHLVTHPMFNSQFGMANSLLICNPSEMQLRPMIDTQLRKNIQNKKSLLREDEFVTSATLETHSIDSNVFVKNCGTYQAS